MPCTVTFAVFMLHNFIKTLGSSKIGKKIFFKFTLRGEISVGSKFREVKNLQMDKLLRRISNNVFCENLTFANDFFKW